MMQISGVINFLRKKVGLNRREIKREFETIRVKQPKRAVKNKDNDIIRKSHLTPRQVKARRLRDIAKRSRQSQRRVA